MEFLLGPVFCIVLEDPRDKNPDGLLRGLINPAEGSCLSHHRMVPNLIAVNIGAKDHRGHLSEASNRAKDRANKRAALDLRKSVETEKIEGRKKSPS